MPFMRGWPDGCRRVGDTRDLNSRLIAAHRSGDLKQMILLYTSAAELADRGGDTDRAAFFRTHAMVIALEAGDPVADKLRATLTAQGRA